MCTTSVPFGFLPWRRAVADVGPAGLVVGEPRHRRHLEPPVAARRVDLDVERAGVGEAEVARAQVEHAVGQAEVGDDRLGPGEDVGVPRGRLLGRAVREQLDLVELVRAQHAAGVGAGRAGLAAEARRVGTEPAGQVGLVEHLVAVHRRERHLGGRDRPEVVALEVIGVVGELGQVPGRHHRLGAHERGRAHLLVRAVAVAVAVERELRQGAKHARAPAAVEREHRPRELHGPLGVEDAELLGDLPVRHALVLAVRVGVEAVDAQHDVVVRAGAVGRVGARQVRDAEHDPAQCSARRRGARPASASSSPSARLSAWRASASSARPSLRSRPTSFERT